MRLKTMVFIVFCVIALPEAVLSQTHKAVPLDSSIYFVLEQAQMRGLCDPLPSTRPYSRSFILAVIDEVLANNESRTLGNLNDAEIRILEQFKQDLNPERDGLDFLRGTYSGDHTWNGFYFSFEFGVGVDLSYSGGYYPIAGGYSYSPTDDDMFKGAEHAIPGKIYNAYEIGATFFFNGDLGRNLSYGFAFSGRILQNPRAILGRGYNNYYIYDDTLGRQITAFGEPLAYFPYTYMRRWDSYIYTIKALGSGGMASWPYGINAAYTVFPELSGNMFDGHVQYRIARLDREWAGMTENSSLVLNRFAQPFLAAELTLIPFKWLSISSLTGVLEFSNGIGIDNNSGMEDSARVFQNAFSLVMLELNFGNYFHFTLGSDVVWPKRFEIGYPFPFAENFTYQNSIGDFDNIALFINIQGQYPGLGKAWFSLFLDELNLMNENFFSQDSSMFALQAGVKVVFPWLPFASITFSYTKIEPYTYTHQRVKTMPWYYGLEMETNYINAGKPLGYYLFPNSDEFLLRFETIPFENSRFSLQYQLIRHGADYGNRSVDGSSLWSELDPINRNGVPELRKFFLRDGAYQWMHILKFTGEYSLKGINWPLYFFMEIGGIYSYFTDIFKADGSPADVNSGSPYPYRVINRPEYPHSLSFIVTIGIKIFSW